jgi:hypothetical protein
MNICRTCKWWQLPPEDEYWGDDDILNPKAHPDVKLPTNFEVRYCNNPRIGFCERPGRPNEASVQDGSYYTANLLTAEQFGCVLHETGWPTLTERERHGNGAQATFG